MRQNGILDEDVDLEELASLCQNFTGAEIVGLINSATSFALNRHIQVGSTVEVTRDASNMRVTREDFIRALDEVHAAYGMAEDEFVGCGQEGVTLFSPEMRQVLTQAQLVVKQAAENNAGENDIDGGQRTILAGILLWGATSSGKTALAAKLATESGFPFAKLLSTHTVVGMNEAAKVNVITRLFLDAYKSRQSLIIVDDVEDLIDFVAIGPRFSSALLQIFRNFFKRAPPPGRRLVIIATTRNKRLLDQLGLSQHFRTQLHVPNVARVEEVTQLAASCGRLDETSRREIIEEVNRIVSRGWSFSIPVKVLQDLFEIAAQDSEGIALRFADEFSPYVITGEAHGNGDLFIPNLNEGI